MKFVSVPLTAGTAELHLCQKGALLEIAGMIAALMLSM
jgi:hypothetical protein